MVDNPKEWIDSFANSGASSITFHYEALKNEQEIELVIKKTKSHHLKVGMAIKPSTPIRDFHFINEIDMLLIMTVEPGFGGQELVPDCIKKIKEARAKWPDLLIQVDGGLTLTNMGELVRAGANAFVAGTMIIQANEPKNIIKEMKNIYKNNLNK